MVGFLAEEIEADRASLAVERADSASDSRRPELSEALTGREGLSCFSDLVPPGILDRIEPLMDLEDSLVSVLLIDGYDCSVSKGPVADELPCLKPFEFSPLDCCWPILKRLL